MNDAARIARAALTVARRVHDDGFEGIIVSGGSHEVSRALLTLGWQALYPGTRMPQTFVLDGEANALLYKRHATAEYPHAFEEWMERELPELAAAKERALCFVDDFALSAEKYRGVSMALRTLGFTDVKYAFFAVAENTELARNAVFGERSNELLAHIRAMGQHIQGKEDAFEMLNEVKAEAQKLRAEALGELRDIGKAMRR